MFSPLLPEFNKAIHQRQGEEVRHRMGEVSAVQQQAVVCVRFELDGNAHISICTTQHGERHVARTHKLGISDDDFCGEK